MPLIANFWAVSRQVSSRISIASCELEALSSQNMKWRAFLFSLLGLAFAGCAAISDATHTVREKFAARDQPQTRTYAADRRATYEAARVAIGQLGFRYVRGGPAQGELDAISGLTADSNSLRTTRQVTLKARFASRSEGGTEVRLWLKEVVEPNAERRAGQATESPLRDTPLYEVFFRTVEQVLSATKRD